jgi:hypothetical protein
MSGYAYDYTLTPARPTGWRSVLAGAVTITAIVGVSAISGAVVTLDLLAPPPTHGDTAMISKAVPAVSAVTTAPAPAAARAAPRAPENPTVAAGPVARDPQPAPAAALAVVSASQPAPAAPAVNAQSSAQSAAQPAPATVPDRDLTFSKGYAQRRAAQEAAAQISTQASKAKVAKVEDQSQFGRSAVKRAKPRVSAPTYAANDPRRPAGARGDTFGFFDRSDQFDFNRHQALAFGEPRGYRHAPPQPPQGGGLFGGLF